MNEARLQAHILWNYLCLNEEIVPMDALIAFGSEATRVAERAAELFMRGYGSYLIVSGGTGTGLFRKTEGERFAEIARKRGVPKERILIEREASNTGENVTFVRRLLETHGLSFSSFILVNKPYLERRTYATFRKQWPEAACVTASPNVSFEEYTASDASAKRHIRFMTAALYRIHEYPKQGFQIYQDIPASVRAAYTRLYELGLADTPLSEA